MSWTPVETDDGSWTLRRESGGVTCHSLAGAWTQARERYAQPCRIAELGAERGTVRALDVGTGLGLNLAAALEALAPSNAKLEALSLERDASVIERSLALAQRPEACEQWLERVQPALRSALAAPDGLRVELPQARGGLRLLLGDARERVRELEPGAFDAVFFDPFAPNDEPDLWSLEFLRSIAAAMAPHAILSTYSASLAVRARLAAAGLSVGLGPRVGRKAQGTLASFTASLPALDARIERRLARRVAEREL